MRAADLDLKDLLSLAPEGGILRFGPQRAVVLDAAALGFLRRELFQTLGPAGARGVLTRFGYAHGWRTAESLRDAFPWDDESEWKRAGGRLHELQGLVVVERASQPDPTAFAESIWHDSYEAEQHVLHEGLASEPVCWTLTGFASGYLSHCHGRNVVCIEDRCRGRGDAYCHVIGRFEEDWGEAVLPHLPFFRQGCLDAALARVTAELAEAERKLRARRKQLGREVAAALDPSGLVAQSEGMKRALDLARRVASVDTTLLVTGESGVGKERIARLVHDSSSRANRPFVAINCGAVPEGLLESELFGHARGSFTGASQDRPGLFEAAHGGTLFLDEVGEVTPAMQVKLLRALQEREVRRVGENKSRKVDVRVIAATNRDLMAEVHGARFRQDLYYRLRVVELRVPPLRERRADILPLALHVLAQAAERTGRKLTGLTPRAVARLERHAWPGNVRELENAIEHAVVLARGSRIDEGDLPEDVRAPPETHRADGEVRSLAEVERDHILAVLARNQGHKERTARDLGIGAATLYRKLKKLDDPSA
ncbi:MAG: sigma-54-dependent Fis family transcriptional regulator [Deltaproteobacteria bacterium]|nr:sigma-54-dependent Fis family transcriptional regulator [Deltaproteobacteria bacterium]